MNARDHVVVLGPVLDPAVGSRPSRLVGFEKGSRARQCLPPGTRRIELVVGLGCLLAELGDLGIDDPEVGQQFLQSVDGRPALQADGPLPCMRVSRVGVQGSSLEKQHRVPTRPGEYRNRDCLVARTTAATE